MHVHGGHPIAVQHLNVGGSFGYLSFRRNQLECPHCGATVMQSVPFMADHHRITKELLQYTKDLLATGTYTLKQVSEITGLGKNTVKAIDLKRLQDKYTVTVQNPCLLQDDLSVPSKSSCQSFISADTVLPACANV
ncbi:helix-turn-helix domain-containing protein [Chordicoccus furentiruminis]|uniref:helix-turn-helix domain-containing protein n=1 Tax=Chordicoccus furentiruminis TaxID=2709410 RepID=UPI0038CBF79E